MQSETKYFQGVYAGPLTMEALDYNGHKILGVPVSDVAEDGSCFFVTLDDHMQVSIAPVIALSVRSYDPEEPPFDPELEPEDYAATRRNLEEIIKRILSDTPQDTEDLRTCAIAMSELANVIDLQTRAQAAQAAGASPCTEEVGSAFRAADGSADTEREGKAFTKTANCFASSQGGRQ